MQIVSRNRTVDPFAASVLEVVRGREKDAYPLRVGDLVPKGAAVIVTRAVLPRNAYVVVYCASNPAHKHMFEGEQVWLKDAAYIVAVRRSRSDKKLVDDQGHTSRARKTFRQIPAMLYEEEQQRAA